MQRNKKTYRTRAPRYRIKEWIMVGATLLMTSAAWASNGADQPPQATAELKAYVTGWVLAPARILIDQDHESVGGDLSSAQWVPSIAYVVTHPVEGIVILDAGLKSGPCDYGMKPIYWVSCKNTAGQDIISQMKANGHDLDRVKYVIPSHWHGDHVSGLGLILEETNARVLATHALIKSQRSLFRDFSGIHGHFLPPKETVDSMSPYAVEDALIGASYDIFGDGSLVMLPTEGHAKGHLSALVQTDVGTVLLTFDAAHLRENLLLSVPSGTSVSKTSANLSLEKLWSLIDTIAPKYVVFGHEPSQWPQGQTEVSFNQSSGLATNNFRISPKSTNQTDK